VRVPCYEIQTKMNREAKSWHFDNTCECFSRKKNEMAASPSKGWMIKMKT